MLILVFSILTGVGVLVTAYGIWVALHLKYLSPLPVWMGVIFCVVITLKAGQLLVEVIRDKP